MKSGDKWYWCSLYVVKHLYVLHSTCYVYTRKLLLLFILLQSPSLHFSLALILYCSMKLELFVLFRARPSMPRRVPPVLTHTLTVLFARRQRLLRAGLPGCSFLRDGPSATESVEADLRAVARWTPRLGWNCPIIHLWLCLDSDTVTFLLNYHDELSGFF